MEVKIKVEVMVRGAEGVCEGGGKVAVEVEFMKVKVEVMVKADGKSVKLKGDRGEVKVEDVR